MNSVDRKNYIMKTALHDGIVSIPEIAAHFDVSVETIRRDVNSLCAEKKLTKVHGGAVPTGFGASGGARVRGEAKKAEAVSGKTVGECAAEMIENGNVVMFDVGEAAQAVARAVHGVRNVTFITNSVKIASILLDKYDAGDFTGSIILIGGELEAKGRFSCSPDAYDEVSKYSADKAFITASAVSAKGVASYNTRGSGYSAKIMEYSDTSILVTESEKFGKKSLAAFASLSSFSCVITDGEKPIPADIANAVTRSGAEIKVADRG